MNIDMTTMYQPATCAGRPSSVAATLPLAPTERRGSAGCAREASAACAKEAAIEAAIRASDVASGTTYRTTLAMAELGRLDMTVRHRPSHIAIRLHCVSDASYAWLISKRPLLECRLTRAFGRPSQVEVIQGAAS